MQAVKIFRFVKSFNTQVTCYYFQSIKLLMNKARSRCFVYQKLMSDLFNCFIYKKKTEWKSPTVMSAYYYFYLTVASIANSDYLYQHWDHAIHKWNNGSDYSFMLWLQPWFNWTTVCCYIALHGCDNLSMFKSKSSHASKRGPIYIYKYIYICVCVCV